MCNLYLPQRLRRLTGRQFISLTAILAAKPLAISPLPMRSGAQMRVFRQFFDRLHWHLGDARFGRQACYCLHLRCETAS